MSAPSVTINGSYGDTPQLLLDATYNAGTGGDCVAFRVLLKDLSGTVIHDSRRVTTALVDSDPFGYGVPNYLISSTTYLLTVEVWDEADGNGSTELRFTEQLVSVASYPDNPKVGSIYEVGINGSGYMLSDRPDGDNRYLRQISPLDTQRFATSSTSFSEAVDRYSMIGQVDWSDGAGQTYLNREQSSGQAFLDSWLVNPFEPGELTALPDSTRLQNVTNALCVVAGGQLYTATGSGSLRRFTDPADSGTGFTITGAAAVKAFCSDGSYWYFADGANIYRNNSAVDPGSAWSAVDAEVMAWCADRLVVARKGSGSATVNEVVVLNDSGAVVGAPQTFTLPLGTTVTSITSGNGYVWWSANRNDKSWVFGWKVTTETTSYFTAFELPAGQQATNIFYYLGNIMMRTAELNATGSIYRAVIWRCPIDSTGLLSPVRVLDIADASINHSVGVFAGNDRFVYFSWTQMHGPSTSVSGLGCIDLSTGGWAKWLNDGTTAATGDVTSIVVWFGRAAYTTTDKGVIVESRTAMPATARLTTSIADLGTGLRKVFTQLTATYGPLPSDASLTFEYSVDGGATWTDFTTLLFGTSVTDSTSIYYEMEAEGESVQLRTTLAGPSSGTPADWPTLKTTVVRAHPCGLADQVLQLPINCADTVVGMNDRDLPENHTGAGARRARYLESLVGSRVRVQDVDWPDTALSQIYDVVAAQTTSVGVYDRTVNRQRQAMICTLSLRRSLK